MLFQCHISWVHSSQKHTIHIGFPIIKPLMAVQRYTPPETNSKSPLKIGQKPKRTFFMFQQLNTREPAVSFTECSL